MMQDVAMSLGCLTGDKDGWMVCYCDIHLWARRAIPPDGISLTRILEVTNLHAKSDKVLVYFRNFIIRCVLPLFFPSLPVCCLVSSRLFLSELRTCNEPLVLTYNLLQMHPWLSWLQLSPLMQLSFQLSRFPICCGKIHKQCKRRTVCFFNFIFFWLDPNHSQNRNRLSHPLHSPSPFMGDLQRNGSYKVG